MTDPAGPPIQQLKQNLRSMWMAGDFGVVARTISAGGDEFVRRLAIPAGSRVLDVACGTGNLAIPLARSGCIVTGVDIAPNLLEQARERASSEGLNATFDEGDAEQLPYADGSFDAVVTMFGAMFAPRPELVAAELARVLKSGGLLAMANWDPQSFTGEMFRLGTKHVPPPPGLPPPVMWGDPEVLKQRLQGNFKDIQTELVPIVFDLPMSPAGTVNFFRTYFGPTKMQFSRLDPSGQDAMAADLETLWSKANTAPDPDNHTVVQNQYLQVKALRA
jgi:ubiquinone/menaquinone biosynthesis C-methylase UbiE